MRYLELFAGAGGMSHGFENAGMTCIGHAEIEPHARAVLRFRWPDTPLHGDVMQVRGERGSCDLVSFGAPCQDLSVAGKRAGLAGARSSLFYQGVRLWDETNATYALYENVLGALSSQKGADFAAVLSAFVGAPVVVPADGWASAGVVAGPQAVAAWRVLDLQHFGPPQRRARVFVLAARAGGVDPAAVLLESDTGACGFDTEQNVVIPNGMPWHPSPREQARQGAAGGVGGGVAGGGIAWALGSHAGCADGDQTNRSHAGGGAVGMGISEELSHSLRAGRTSAVAFALRGREDGAVPEVSPDGTVNALRGASGGSSRDMVVDVVGTLRSGGVGGVPRTEFEHVVTQPLAFDNRPQVMDGGTVNTLTTEGMRNPMSVVQTLIVGGRDKGAGDSYDNTPVVVQDQPVSFYTHLGTQGGGVSDNGVTPTLKVDNTTSVLCTTGDVLQPLAFAQNQRGEVRTSDVMTSLNVGGGKPGEGYAAVLCTTGDVTHALTHEGADASEDGTGRGTPIVVPALMASMGKGPGQNRDELCVSQMSRPRRLTPLECERLQSWPDDWTKVGVNEKGVTYELSDTARYRLMGNGVASVVAEWIGRRLFTMHNDTEGANA